jgi:hypothetical protein
LFFNLFIKFESMIHNLSFFQLKYFLKRRKNFIWNNKCVSKLFCQSSWERWFELKFTKITIIFNWKYKHNTFFQKIVTRFVNALTKSENFESYFTITYIESEQDLLTTDFTKGYNFSLKLKQYLQAKLNHLFDFIWKLLFFNCFLNIQRLHDNNILTIIQRK